MYILYKMKGKGVKVKNVVTLRGKKIIKDKRLGIMDQEARYCATT